MWCTYFKWFNRFKSKCFFAKFSRKKNKWNQFGKKKIVPCMDIGKTMSLKIVTTAHCILTIELMQMHGKNNSHLKKSMLPRQCECTANYWNDDCISKAHLNRFLQLLPAWCIMFLSLLFFSFFRWHNWSERLQISRYKISWNWFLFVRRLENKKKKEKKKQKNERSRFSRKSAWKLIFVRANLKPFFRVHQTHSLFVVQT